MTLYNQELQKQTGYSCTIYTMLNIIKYDYGVELKIDWILKIVIYMEKIGVLLPKGAYFSIIYPAMKKLIENRTGFKLKIKKSYISKGLDDKSMWGLGYKYASRLYKELSIDGKITKADILTLSDYNKGYGHNHAWKLGNKTNKGIILETLGGYPYQVSIKTLQYAQGLNMYYDTARTFIPADERTEKKQKELVSVAKKRKRFIPYEEFITIYK